LNEFDDFLRIWNASRETSLRLGQLKLRLKQLYGETGDLHRRGVEIIHLWGIPVGSQVCGGLADVIRSEYGVTGGV
jgi:hypothetical protein